MSIRNDARRIALIGFGEVGRIFGRGFVAAGFAVTAYDILFDDPAKAAEWREMARQAGVVACVDAAQAAAGARVVISAVTAAAARSVAREAARWLGPGQFFLDLNSVSPETKRANAADVDRSGAAYVEAAVMAPVSPLGLSVPILLGGARADELAATLAPAGMRLEVATPVIGQASAIKMCRSIMIKGMEALTVECLMTARRYGVEDTIIASLNQSFPGLAWERQAGYNIERVVQHGRRRAAEMREVAATVGAAGLEPLMASATAERQDWVADLVERLPGIRSADETDWRTTLDRLGALLAPPRTSSAAD